MQASRALRVSAFCLLLVYPGSMASSREDKNSGCRVDKNAAAFRVLGWQPQSRVRVFSLEGHFKDSEVVDLRRAFENWNSVSKESAWQVIFSYEGSVSTTKNCDGCLTIMRGRIARENHAALLDAVAIAETRIITYAKIILDQDLKDSNEISNAIAHEVGHSFGLLDCYSCRPHSTVMNAVNSSRGLALPSACDISQVKRTYELQHQHARAREANRRAKADEGEEPVEDDTPVIKEPVPISPR